MTPVGKIDDTENEHSKDIPVPEPAQEPEKILPLVLTNEQYLAAMSADVVGITAALNYYSKNGRSMNSDYRDNLTAQLDRITELEPQKETKA